MDRRVKHHLTWKFFRTEREATDFCEDTWNNDYTPYMRQKHKKPHPIIHCFSDGMDGFIVWYYYKVA